MSTVLKHTTLLVGMTSSVLDKPLLNFGVLCTATLVRFSRGCNVALVDAVYVCVGADLTIAGVRWHTASSATVVAGSLAFLFDDAEFDISLGSLLF